MRRLSPLALPGARPAVLLAALPTLVGCYATRPIPAGASLPAGRRVAVELTAQGGAALTGILGPQVERVEGEVVRVAADSLHLAVIKTERFGAREDSWQRQQIGIPTSAIHRVAERRLDRKRSWITAGLLVLGAAAAAALVRGGGLGGGDGVGGVSPTS
jgi:nucleotide-binding universal stress UspA family protein